MQRIRIIHILDHFDVGGLQNGVVHIINGLDGDLFEHRVCAIRGVGQSRHHVRRPDVLYYDMQKPPAHDPWMPGRLARLFRKERPHVVHTRNWGAMEGIFGAKLAGVPAIVHSEHGRDQLNMQTESRRRILTRRLMFRLADRVFTVSTELRDYYHALTGFPLDRLATIPNGVDLRRFSSAPAEGHAIRASLGLGENTFVLGTVGRLDPVKDQMSLLRAARVLLARDARLHVLIMGEGPQRPALEAYIRAEGLASHVSLLGHRTDAAELLAALDVFVLPSLSEGMSNTVLEAMASGRAVVATRVGGNPQLIEDGVSGLLFSAGDVAELVAHLDRLRANPVEREGLGHHARRRVETEFSLSRMIDRYTGLYMDLAKRKGLRVSPSGSPFVAT